MRYGLGDNLADYGFGFLEKLHSPIFLVHRSGAIKKMNEAARKLMKVARVEPIQIETAAAACLNTGRSEHLVLSTSRKKLRLISQPLLGSDFILVELIR